MLSIQPKPSIPSCSPTKVTPHLLPCRTTHNGSVNASKFYWSPEPSSEDSNSQVAYFRGRRLLGREIRLPDTHRGVVARTTERTVERKEEEGQHFGEQDDYGDVGIEEEEDKAEVKILEEVGGFERVVLWGHEELPGESEEFVRGVGEWIGFAEGVHSWEGKV
ncbi:MAG: hypothetical protein MMC23_006711 [Stictis urceolatum]|nr:hypothetical protein [Stictis urceolata]